MTIGEMQDPEWGVGWFIRCDACFTANPAPAQDAGMAALWGTRHGWMVCADGRSFCPGCVSQVASSVPMQFVGGNSSVPDATREFAEALASMIMNKKWSSKGIDLCVAGCMVGSCAETVAVRIFDNEEESRRNVRLAKKMMDKGFQLDAGVIHCAGHASPREAPAIVRSRELPAFDDLKPAARVERTDEIDRLLKRGAKVFA